MIDNGAGAVTGAMTKECLACRAQIAAEARYCSRCGAAQAEAIEPAAPNNTPAAATATDAAAPAEPPPAATVETAPPMPDPADNIAATAVSADVTGEIEVVTPIAATAPALDAEPVQSTAEGKRPWHRRRALLLLTGAIAVCASVLAAVLATRSPSAAALHTALDSSHTHINKVASTFVNADTMPEVRAAGRAAQRSSSEVSALLPKVRTSGTKEQRRVAVQALTGEGEYLQALAQFASFEEAKLEAWTQTKSTLDERVRGLQRAQSELTLLGDRNLVAIPVSNAEDAVTALDRWVGSSSERLAAWRAAADNVRRDKDGQLAALGAYEAAFRELVNQYTGLRRDMQDFTNRVDSAGATYTEAHAALATASAERSRVRNTMKALTPPPPMVGAQTAVVHVIERSVTAVNSAAAGVRQDEIASYYYYSYYKDTPGWREFQRSSSAITREYDEALRAWEAALAAEKNRINAVPLPEKPSV